MYLKALLLLLSLQLTLAGETKLLLDFTVNNPKELIQLDEAIRLGADLRSAIKQLKIKQSDTDELNQLEAKLSDYELKLQKSYGLFPGLNYKMIATSGYIFNLIPIAREKEYIEKGFTVNTESPTVMVKDKSGKGIECYKIKVRLLQKRESVLQFNNALKTSFSIRQQIASLEAQLESKPEIGKKEEIKKGMLDLKAALVDIEKKMLESFGVRNDGKYIFEPKTGAVYLALNKEDLKKLSDLNKARNK